MHVSNVVQCCNAPVQVTKLCDLGAGDSVCSVSWSQRGTYLSVGTNTGEVQVSRSAGRVFRGMLV